jgi:hypothetical protein
MAKNQLGHINFFFLVNLNGNAGAIVQDGNTAFFTVDFNLEHVHLGITLLVVSCTASNTRFMRKHIQTVA